MAETGEKLIYKNEDNTILKENLFMPEDLFILVTEDSRYKECLRWRKWKYRKYVLIFLVCVLICFWRYKWIQGIITDRVPEELWTEVRDIVHEVVIKTIPKKKKCKKAKRLSEEALQIVEKRREAKGKGEKEGYSHLNTEFQRIARSDKKASLSNQCREIGKQ